ncbi:MAG TPA: hypothetical protein VK869_05955 [Rubrobacteraceae bacterium]|nr:hypothetical protein [Rubrobacteraceae bacterium]
MAGSLYRCAECGGRLDPEGVARWVREAEEARDEYYSDVKGDGFDEIVRDELQREVYRRRRVMYDLQKVPRAMARPEMILVTYEVREGAYECRIFYKEPRPVGGVERVSVGDNLETILELRSDPDPVVRLVAEKVEEFHALRTKHVKDGVLAPGRRVFYANEL